MRVDSGKLRGIRDKTDELTTWIVSLEGYENHKCAISTDYIARIYLTMWQTEGEMLRFAKYLRAHCILLDLKIVSIDILTVMYQGDDARGEYRYEVILEEENGG